MKEFSLSYLNIDQIKLHLNKIEITYLIFTFFILFRFLMFNSIRHFCDEFHTFKPQIALFWLFMREYFIIRFFLRFDPQCFPIIETTHKLFLFFSAYINLWINMYRFMFLNRHEVDRIIYAYLQFGCRG